MLTLRPAQVQVFSEAALKSFVDLAVTHLKKFFPKQCKAMGDPKLREAIRHGVKRAEVYSITAKSDVAKYLDLMMVLGPDFDTDKKLPWAGQILRTGKPPSDKVSALLKFTATELHDQRKSG